MASASTPSANEQAKYVVLVHRIQEKPMIKAQISGIMTSSGISDVANASVYSQKTHLKKLIMIIILLMNKLQAFWRAPEIDFRYETGQKSEQFDALYR